MLRFNFSAALIVACTLSPRMLIAQCTSWINRNATFKPQYETLGKLAYDELRGVTVLYGRDGTGCCGPSVATWMWSGEVWAYMHTKDCPACPGQNVPDAMAFDANRGVAVLYRVVGSFPSFKPQTWEWNGSNWDLRSTSGPIVGRDSMIYDSHRRKVLLLGFWNSTSNAPGIWEWDGLTWADVSPSSGMPNRYSTALCFDSRRNRVVLFGGEGPPPNDRLADTWEFDGVSWCLMSAVGPPGRRLHVMAYDALRGVSVLFGGEVGNNTYPNDTWEWDGVNWTPIDASVTSPARVPAGAVFDSRRGKVVMYYSGHDPTGYPTEVWEYPAQSRPVFKTHPKSQTACLGGMVLLSADASSETAVSYQWRRNGAYIQDATSPTLFQAHVDFGSIGTYDLIATNACGATISESATLLVCAGPGGCPQPVDVNGDGTIDGLDVQRIVEVLLNL